MMSDKNFYHTYTDSLKNRNKTKNTENLNLVTRSSSLQEQIKKHRSLLFWVVLSSSILTTLCGLSLIGLLSTGIVALEQNVAVASIAALVIQPLFLLRFLVMSVWRNGDYAGGSGAGYFSGSDDE